ncbi:PadR family transcriptional regulator [Pantanalinema sp. GBBB05]|uniref:PadR family transcriptional regulator n=1 Tax=Pantanalinema sp. GBBB05 TaxID=2604139 RepID=UPI001D6EF109|nr:PadR family transcriptional regulator [Pantanalinema sp. GBBB05]
MEKDLGNAVPREDGGGKSRQNYLLSALEEDILTVLLGRELYGLQISQAIEDSSDGRRKINVSSLYPSLRRLEEKEFVTSYWEINDVNINSKGEERGGARRRYYRITPTGSKVLNESREVREKLLRWMPV